MKPRYLLRPEVSQLSSDIEKAINELRNENWTRRLKMLPQDDQNRSLFRATKFLRSRGQGFPPLKVEGKTLITPMEKAEALADQFEANHQNPLAGDNASNTNYVEQSVNRFMQHCPTDLEPEMSTTVEIGNAIKKLKNPKASGVDGINNRLIKQLPPLGIF